MRGCVDYPKAREEPTGVYAKEAGLRIYEQREGV
jgi:hypothetical protein